MAGIDGGREVKLCYAGHVLTEKHNGLALDSARSNGRHPPELPTMVQCAPAPFRGLAFQISAGMQDSRSASGLTA